MLLTITTTRRPAADVGYLLHKNPARCQSFPLSFGQAHVFDALMYRDKRFAGFKKDQLPQLRTPPPGFGRPRWACPSGTQDWPLTDLA